MMHGNLKNGRCVMRVSTLLSVAHIAVVTNHTTHIYIYIYLVRVVLSVNSLYYNQQMQQRYL